MLTEITCMDGKWLEIFHNSLQQVDLSGWCEMKLLKLIWIKQAISKKKARLQHNTGLHISDWFVILRRVSQFYNGFPFADEKVKIKERLLPYYCKNLANKHNILVGTKLVPNLS